jgi:hypothetical protein
MDMGNSNLNLIIVSYISFNRIKLGHYHNCTNSQFSSRTRGPFNNSHRLEDFTITIHILKSPALYLEEA